MGVPGKIVPKAISTISSKLSSSFDDNPVLSGWILETSFWADAGRWIDTEVWQD